MLEGMGSEVTATTSKGSSFRDKLVGTPDILPGEDGDEWLSEDDDPLSEEDIDVTCPIIPLSKRNKIRMRSPWK